MSQPIVVFMLYHCSLTQIRMLVNDLYIDNPHSLIKKESFIHVFLFEGREILSLEYVDVSN